MKPAFKSTALLAMLMAVSALLAGAIAAGRFGSSAYAASALAAFVVWVAGVGAVMLTLLPQSPAGRLNGALAAILVRTGLLLVALVVCSKLDHPLVEAGLVGLGLVHYLVALVAETLLCVRVLKGAPSSVQPSPAAH